ncbi:alpha-amylase family glycosyl hydrolase [Mucisphaera sp.]|uniref:alpha-amylase family glycosyl hydrolase n=1 Tax=Mucisphaera sp. TaxID=2913024 RepID=UPI003D1363C6
MTTGWLRTFAAAIIALAIAPIAGALPATDDVVMYEINPRAFSEQGDLDSITANLDRLERLHVNVIWLMPIHPIGVERSVGDLGSPYAVRDYRAVRPELGTLEDLRELIAEAHRRDMAVILDWVANHTAWDHPWINTQPDWYTRNDAGDITHPPGTNWLDVADLDFDNPELRQAMIDAMIFWVRDVGVDGFRCDYADGVPVDFWAEANAAIRAAVNRPILMLAEGARKENLTEAGFDINFDWSFYDGLKRTFTQNETASSLHLRHLENYRDLRPDQHWLRWITNHDQYAWDGSLIELFGSVDASLAAYAIALYQGGVPLIYNGQELAHPERIPFFSQQPLDWSQGPEVTARYQQLMRVYHQNPALRSGRLADLSNDDVAAFLRYDDHNTLLILVNVRNHPASLTLPWPQPARDLLTGKNHQVTRQVTLTPYEIRVLALD